MTALHRKSIDDPDVIRKRAFELFETGLTNMQIAPRLSRGMSRIARLRREWKKAKGA